jgi:hypothetical protein
VNDRFADAADPVCAYSLPHYRHLLERAKTKYWLPLVREVNRSGPDRDLLLIRHDVDITPWSALRMAELEHSLGVHTTYYSRFHAPFYNLMAEDVIDSVRAVAAMGHEVGLHYEPGFFCNSRHDPCRHAQRHPPPGLVCFRTHSIAQHQPAQGPVPPTSATNTRAPTNRRSCAACPTSATAASMARRLRLHQVPPSPGAR